MSGCLFVDLWFVGLAGHLWYCIYFAVIAGLLACDVWCWLLFDFALGVVCSCLLLCCCGIWLFLLG